jgi:hypothetical protein
MSQSAGHLLKYESSNECEGNVCMYVCMNECSPWATNKRRKKIDMLSPFD